MKIEFKREEGGQFESENNEYTPTEEERVNKENDEAVEVAQAPDKSEDDSEKDADLSEEAFAELMQETGSYNVDWSDGYDPKYATCLEEYTKLYYEQRIEEILNGQLQPLELFDENV